MNLLPNLRLKEWSMPLTLFLFLGVALFLHTALPASADMGPRPTMTFGFVYEIEPVPIVGGLLIECNEPDCSDGRPLEEGGPQRFDCPTREPDTCFAMAYGFRQYHKLIIEFADGTRESNIFRKRAFAETFTVTVGQSSLLVERTSLWATGFGLALLATLVVELLVAVLYLSLLKLPRALLIWVLVANLITLPIVWFLLATVPLPAVLVICGYELFAVVVEVVILYMGGRKWDFALKHALTLGVIMNLLSFLVGFMFLGSGLGLPLQG